MISTIPVQILIPGLSIVGVPGEMVTLPYSAVKNTGTPPVVEVQVTLSSIEGVESIFWEVSDQPYRLPDTQIIKKAVIGTSTERTATFLLAVDTAGSYLVRCKINGGATRTSAIVAVLTEGSELRYPAVGEAKEAGPRGWQEAYEKAMRAIEDGISPIPPDFNSRHIITVDPGATREDGGANLLAAHAAAKALALTLIPQNPHSRVKLFVPAGRYLLPSTLILDSNYVDLVGEEGTVTSVPASYASLSPQDRRYTLPPLTIIEAEFNGSVVRDSRLMSSTRHIVFESLPAVPNLNLDAAYELSSNGTYNWYERCVFNLAGQCKSFVTTHASRTIASTFVGCSAGDSFLTSLTGNLVISGNAVDCISGNSGFGCNSHGTVVVSGTFRNCFAGHTSFGCSVSEDPSHTVMLTGTFIGCKALTKSFGYVFRSSVLITIPGYLTDCIASEYSFGCSEALVANSQILMSVQMLRCTGGHHSFGSGLGTGNVSLNGSIVDCSAADYSFGYRHCNGGIAPLFSSLGAANLAVLRCTAGAKSFLCSEGEDTGFSVKNVAFTDCTAGDYSFMCSVDEVVIVGKAEPEAEYHRFIRCTGGTRSFISAASGITQPVKNEFDTVFFEDCRGTDYCFVSSENGHVIIQNATFSRCTASNASFGYTQEQLECFNSSFLGCIAEESAVACGGTPDSIATGLTVDGCRVGDISLMGIGGQVTGSQIKNSSFAGTSLPDTEGCRITNCTFGNGCLRKVVDGVLEDSDLGPDFSSYGGEALPGLVSVNTRVIRCQSIGRTTYLWNPAGYFEGCIFEMPFANGDSLMYLETYDRQPTLYNCTLICGTEADPGDIFEAGDDPLPLPENGVYYVGVAHCRMSTDNFGGIDNVYGDTALAQNVVSVLVRKTGMAIMPEAPA